MKNIFTRPLTADDVRWLDATRRSYWHADLELPHDFTAPGVMTVGLHEAHRLFGSLTGTKAVVLDPFIHDASYDAAQGAKLIYGLVKADAILTHWGQQGGAVDSYIAIPSQLKAYARLLENYGYSVTCQNCVILRRALTPETVPMLGEEREAAEKARLEKEHASQQPKKIWSVECGVCRAKFTDENPEVVLRTMEECRHGGFDSPDTFACH